MLQAYYTMQIQNPKNILSHFTNALHLHHMQIYIHKWCTPNIDIHMQSAQIMDKQLENLVGNKFDGLLKNLS